MNFPTPFGIWRAMPSVQENSKLPIQHPDYRYPSSLNPYWTSLKGIDQQVYIDNTTEEHAGEWKKLIGNVSGSTPKTLHVEIGCNGGHVVLEWAAARPHDGFIGLDWKFKQIYRGYEKGAKRGLKNLFFLRAHAIRIERMFGVGEIDHLYLLFPDPWPKKAQWKNRLFTAEWLRQVARLIRPSGTFEIRTDHAGYFEWMLVEFAKMSDLFEAVETSKDLYAGHPNPQSLKIPEVTLFERLFIADGIKINKLLLKRI